MKKYFFFFSFIIFTSQAFSQEFPSELWHQGKVVLVGGDTLKGKVKYDFENDLVQVDAGGALRTYSSKKLFYFEIFDETANSYRYFYSLPYGLQSDYEVPVLFEVLYEGKLTLLSREHLVTENVTPTTYGYYYYPPGPSYTRVKLAYSFYFLEENGTIEYYNLKKKDLLSIFGKRSKEVNQYMKKNNLKHDNLRDLVRITAYYNAIIQS